MLVGAIVATLMTLLWVGRATRETLRLRALRRTGVRVEGEVIDNEARNRPYYGGALLYPVVRYQLDGKMHQGTVRNWIGKVELGSGLPLLVDPDDPYLPAAADRDSTVRGLAAGLITLVLALLLTWWAYTIRFH
ncbi:DUF3592 domain-containing protein [Kribbella sp. NPDC006257]|uniref:DUF3592 domain-containing protein n=1 Tax=Kribbella sp. NPDC006257 TaxID=3156738 RepID=UPI0033BBED73